MSRSSNSRKKEIKQCAKILREISRKDGNNRCADCSMKNPAWVSFNIGCFVCIRCSGLHRNLGVHISYVKSISLDDWNFKQLDQFKKRAGNTVINSFYEATLPKAAKIDRDTSEYDAQDFIRQKYEFKKWYSRKPKKSKPHKSNKLKKKEKHKHHKKNAKSHHNRDPSPKIIKKLENPQLQKEQPRQQKDAKMDENDQLIPDLLDDDALEKFAFSDLSTFDHQKSSQNNDSSFDPMDDVKMNNNAIHHEIDNKTKILSKYNNNPGTWVKFEANTPKTMPLKPVPSINDYSRYINNTNSFNYNYNNNQNANVNDMISSPVPVTVPRRNSKQLILSLYPKNNYQEPKPVIDDKQIPAVNPIKRFIRPKIDDERGIGIVNNVHLDKKQSILSLYHPPIQPQSVPPQPQRMSSKPFRNDINDQNDQNAHAHVIKSVVAFDPFNHISQLCANPNNYVYNPSY